MKRLSLSRTICLAAITGVLGRYPPLPVAMGAPTPTSVRLDDSSPGEDWAAYGRTYGEQHFSPLVQINARNVKSLGLAWALDLGPGNPATIPIEVRGVLYFASGLSVVRAVDATSGTVLWTYDPAVARVADTSMRQGWGSRGLGYWNDTIYVGTLDGRLIALNAKTGLPVWSIATFGPDEGRYITGAPRAFDGKVIIGHGGNDSASVRGYVSCYDADTGKLRWRFYTVPGDPARGFEDGTQKMTAKTWSGDWWKYGGGGTVWNSFAYDEASRTVFLGTGNGAPWNHRVRSEGKGDNLFVASIVALDAGTGRYKWHYQVNPGDTWDYDASVDMQLADLTIDGVPRKVLMQASKNGFFYVIDRIDGSLISAQPYAKVTWASKIDSATGRPVEDPAARFPHGTTFELWPSFFGAHSWMPSAFSPQTGLMYVPVVEKAAVYDDKGIDASNWVRTPAGASDSAVNLGPGTSHNQLDGTSWLLAIDPTTQRHVWKVRTPTGGNGGVLATAGDLVFQGERSGNFAAYDAASGEKLWSFGTLAGIVAAPISYSVGGTQYVSLAVGVGTGAAFLAGDLAGSVNYRTQPKRLLTFALGATHTLPPAPATASAVPDDPRYRADDAQGLTGAIKFGRYCSHCHGFGAIGVGNAPDLRYSAVPLSADAFKSVVHDGVLLDRGMPKFGEFDAQTLDAIRQYLRSQMAAMRASK
jgi:quinohemoprotein ethanol dehydrogenase